MVASAELRASDSKQHRHDFHGIGEEREGGEEKGTGDFNWPVMDTMGDTVTIVALAASRSFTIGERASAKYPV
jgi:hypothetical protein